MTAMPHPLVCGNLAQDSMQFLAATTTHREN
ncbi:hypothetical protein ACQP3J_33790, partial [Escherichia coli]